jgi:hypothetical protein
MSIMPSGGNFAKYWGAGGGGGGGGGGGECRSHKISRGYGGMLAQNCNYAYYGYKSEINWVLHLEIYYDYMEFPTIWLALQSECDLS